MDPYWSRLLNIYDDVTSDTLPTNERWKIAYELIRREMGIYQESGQPPSFDPPAQTAPEFAAQYAESIDYMIASGGTHLILPKDFNERWQKIEEQDK